MGELLFNRQLIGLHALQLFEFLPDLDLHFVEFEPALFPGLIDKAVSQLVGAEELLRAFCEVYAL